MSPAHHIKSELAALGALTEVGFQADQSDTIRIHELASNLEQMNPKSTLDSSIQLMRGRWRLLYSNFELQRRTTLRQLSRGTLPSTPVQAIEFYNEINPKTGDYDNIIHYLDDEGLFGILVMSGHFHATSPRDLEVSYQEARLMGASDYLSYPVHDAHLSPMTLHNTYLDDGFRLARGAFGSLYILERLDPDPLHWTRDDWAPS